ncbi:MAG: hypothetical protein JJU27_19465 [Gammaproteobacteria bacterium]|nr:hypothetical protein [Gammaproteobacteria bacterium]
MTPPHQGLNTRNAVFIGLLLGGVLAYLLYHLFQDLSLGGNSWKQGDWLINELSGPIRRGLFGSSLLRISDFTGLNPLLLLVLLQASFVALIFVVTGLATYRLGVPDKLVLLLLSPAFVMFFWFNDPQGSVRKEILAYLAFLPMIVAALTLKGHAGIVAYTLSMIAYAIAMTAHEANVFFLPFLWIAMWLMLPPNASVRLRAAVIAIPGLLALAGGLYATINTHLPDPGVICLQVIERGLDPSICGGAIDYLESTPQEARMHPGRLFSTHFRNFLLIYAACLMCFRVLLQGSERADTWLIVTVVSGLAFFPLYLLAGDYGRWLNFHVTSLVLLSLVFLLKYRPAWLYDRPRRLDYASVIAISLIVGVSHSPGELIDGFLVKVAHGVYSSIT